MKKVIGTFLILSVLFISCNTPNAGDPKVVADQFIDAVTRKDMAAVRNLTTAESKFVLDQMENAMKSKDANMKFSEFDRSKVKLGKVSISGDNATVQVTETKSGEMIELPLKKESGKWKVSLDVSTMMNMAMKKMKEKGINISDSLIQKMPSLNNINMDSISRVMQEKGITADSLKKMLRKSGINIDSVNIKIN
ncbi:MAG: hypothetical protein WKF35_12995 [Ferruginibacter sp.]